MKIIKRYKNRKLYDLQRHYYIKYDQLLGYIDDGVHFKVVDCDGTNITQKAVLLAVEKEAHKLNMNKLTDIIKSRRAQKEF